MAGDGTAGIVAVLVGMCRGDWSVVAAAGFGTVSMVLDVDPR